jgi:tetratricopeptide (TPR) repeat protein
VTPPGPVQRSAPRDRGRSEQRPSARNDERSQPERAALVRAPTGTDADLRELWTKWRRAITEGAASTGAEEAAKALLAAKEELGISDLESFSVAVARLAVRRHHANEPVEAVELARLSVALAPHLPWSRFTLARMYFFAEPASVDRWAGEAWESLVALGRDPRHLRPVLADSAAAAIGALVATALAAIGVLFVRRARCFFHDFHHLFPRAAAKWQTVPFAVLLLILPLGFRMGLVPALAVLLASVSLYLEWKERIVGAALLAALALVPLLGRAASEANSVAGTVAEDIQVLDRGGLDAASAAQEVKARIAEQRADFAEIYALGRYELRRGHLDDASDLFKKAALLRRNDAHLLTALGNARFGAGDLEGAKALYSQAKDADPSLGAAHYNLARIHERKSRTLAGADQALALEEALTERQHAIERDPSLAARPEPAADEVRLNQLVVTPELPWEEVQALAVLPEVADRVGNQLSWWLIGTNAGAWTVIAPLALALLVLGIGALRAFVAVSDLCERCGLAGCRRCDPEFGRRAGQCSQCVHVFTRRGAVAPQVKVRKQLEVNRYELRRARLSWLLGIACSGAGHLFNGRPVHGALFAFAALFLISSAALGEGILRAPYGDFPLALRLAPVVVALAVVYLLSLRSLRKAHTR